MTTATLTAIRLVLLLSTTMPATAAFSHQSNQRLSGQRVLVTGAGRGVGRAIAVICHKHGAKVAITARTESELQETRAIMLATTTAAQQQQVTDHEQETSEKEREVADNERIFLQTTDVTNSEQVETLVRGVAQAWGDLDILINNAGTSQLTKGPMETLSALDLQTVLNHNVVAVHLVTSHVVKHCMQPENDSKDDSNNNKTSKRRSILNISSKAGKIGIPNNSFYVASKFALEGLTASWAAELKEAGIVVNSLSPGMVNTQSFPKPPDRKGVRSAESIEDGLLFLLTAAGTARRTGHYLHVDEFDEVRRRGLPPETALKDINERNFVDTLPSQVCES